MIAGRSMITKKNDGIKESTDSSTTIEDEDTRGKHHSILAHMTAGDSLYWLGKCILKKIMFENFEVENKVKSTFVTGCLPWLFADVIYR